MTHRNLLSSLFFRLPHSSARLPPDVDGLESDGAELPPHVAQFTWHLDLDLHDQVELLGSQRKISEHLEL